MIGEMSAKQTKGCPNSENFAPAARCLNAKRFATPFCTFLTKRIFTGEFCHENAPIVQKRFLWTETTNAARQASVLSMRFSHRIEKTLVLSRKCITKFAKKHKTHLRLNIQYIWYSAVCLLLRKPATYNYSIYNKSTFFHQNGIQTAPFLYTLPQTPGSVLKTRKKFKFFWK